MGGLFNIDAIEGGDVPYLKYIYAFIIGCLIVELVVAYLVNKISKKLKNDPYSGNYLKKLIIYKYSAFLIPLLFLILFTKEFDALLILYLFVFILFVIPTVKYQKGNLNFSVSFMITTIIIFGFWFFCIAYSLFTNFHDPKILICFVFGIINGLYISKVIKEYYGVDYMQTKGIIGLFKLFML